MDYRRLSRLWYSLSPPLENFDFRLDGVRAPFPNLSEGDSASLPGLGMGRPARSDAFIIFSWFLLNFMRAISNTNLLKKFYGGKSTWI